MVLLEIGTYLFADFTVGVLQPGPLSAGAYAFRGRASAAQLKFAIQLQSKLAYATGGPKPMGAFLLENGVVKPSQLSLALEQSGRTGKQLGQVLVEHNVISQEMVEVFLKMQRAQVIA
jgi:hypothetical protein